LPDGLRVLDGILETLVDGKLHRIQDLSVKTGMPEEKLRPIIEFLSQHGFVHRRESEDSIRIEPRLRELIEG